MVIRLGHFSVREYLVSEGIKDSKVSKFSIIDIVADLFIAESCLQYILYYDGLDSKDFFSERFGNLPALGILMPILVHSLCKIFARKPEIHRFSLVIISFGYSIIELAQGPSIQQ